MTETAPARHANAHPVFARILNSIFDVEATANAPDDINDIDDRDVLDAEDQKQAEREERIRAGSEIK